MSTAIVGRGRLPEPPAEHASAPAAAAAGPRAGRPDPAGHVATVATEATTPGVVRFVRRVMLAPVPTATLLCCEAANATCTERLTRFPASRISPLPARARVGADTEVTRTATGSNTTWPERQRASLPDSLGGLEPHHRRRGERPKDVGPRIKLSRGDVAERHQIALSSATSGPSPGGQVR